MSGTTLGWVNVDELDEPRWGDRWSTQTNAKGEPLYMIGNRHRTVPAVWIVSRSDGSEVGKADTLTFAKEIAQDDHDNGATP